MSPAEVDEHYILEVGVVGDIKSGLEEMAKITEPRVGEFNDELRQTIMHELNEFENDTSFPVKPQRIDCDLVKL